MTPPAFTIGVPTSTDEVDLAGTLASLQASAARAGLPYEIVVAVNGPGEPAPAARDARGFAIAAGLTLEEDAATGSSAPAAADATSPQRLRLLRLAPRSKVAAWNAIRAEARGAIIVFADADVRVAPDAVGRLVHRLADAPELAAVAGREAAILTPDDGLVARLAALPYRFDFANVSGRLYAIRTGALEALPAHVLHEDAYLTVRLGRHRFVKQSDAIVYLRPPTTWHDYLRQRVRNEVGKLQLTREFADLHAQHGFGRYPWGAFLRGIRARELPLVALSLATRVYARARARREVRAGFPTGWSVLPSTKRWTAGAEGR
jgi:hypothetical protein